MVISSSGSSSSNHKASKVPDCMLFTKKGGGINSYDAFYVPHGDIYSLLGCQRFGNHKDGKDYGQDADGDYRNQITVPSTQLEVL